MGCIAKIKRREENDGLCDRCVKVPGELWTPCALWMCESCSGQHLNTGTCRLCLDAFTPRYAAGRGHE